MDKAKRKTLWEFLLALVQLVAAIGKKHVETHSEKED